MNQGQQQDKINLKFKKRPLAKFLKPADQTTKDYVRKIFKSICISQEQAWTLERSGVKIEYEEITTPLNVNQKQKIYKYGCFFMMWDFDMNAFCGYIIDSASGERKSKIIFERSKTKMLVKLAELNV